jgi:hypothetical protein
MWFRAPPTSPPPTTEALLVWGDVGASETWFTSSAMAAGVVCAFLLYLAVTLSFDGRG